MKNLLAAAVAAIFALVPMTSFAAAHTAAQPGKDAKAAAVDCKDAKNKDHKDCAPKKDEMKKEAPKK
jgi:hypothetical protein